MNRRILLIDADPDFRSRLTQQLARYRFDLAVEPDHDEALVVGATQQPAAVVVAVEEPDKAGFKLLQKLKRGPLARTPVVLVTRSVTPESFAKHRGLKVHADEYLDKRTLTDDELLGKLDALIGLGAPADDLDIPVEVDDIALGDGDMVLDESVGEDIDLEDDDDDGGTTGVGIAGDGGQLAREVDAETDAAFDALLGGLGDDDLAVPQEPEVPDAPVVPDAREPRAASQPLYAEQQGREEISVVTDPVPAPIHDTGRRGSGGIDFDSFSRESRRPALAKRQTRARFKEQEQEAQEAQEAQVAAQVPAEDPQVSSAAIQLEPDDLQPIDDDDPGALAVPIEPAAREVREAPVEQDAVPHAMSLDDVDDVEPAPVADSRAKFIDAPTVADGKRGLDFGIDQMVDEAPARSDDSGVYDRRALRKIGELERQIAQLKTELDRARASVDAASRGPNREREFRTLREQMIQRESELGRSKQDLAARERELAEAHDRLRQAQQARTSLEAKTVELESRLDRDVSKVATLEGTGRVQAQQLATLQHDLEAKTQALAAAEARRTQLDRDIASERALRAASTSEAERALRVEREQMIARHQGELGALRQELVQAHASAVDSAREELAGEHARAIADAVEATRAELRAEAATAASELAAQREAELAGLRGEHQAQLAAAAGDRDAAHTARETALARLRDEHAVEVDALEAAHREAQAAAIDAAVAAAVAEAVARADEAADQRLAAELGRLRDIHETALARTSIDASRKATADAHAEAQADRARRDAEHVARLTAVQGEHAVEVSRLRAAHANELSTLRDETSNQLISAAADHDEALSSLDGELQTVRGELDATRGELDALDRQLASSRREGEAARAEVAEAQRVHASELVAQAQQHAAQLAAREQAWDANLDARERELRGALERATATHETALAAQVAIADELRGELARAAAAQEEAASNHTAARREAALAHEQAQQDAEQALAAAQAEHARMQQEVAAAHERVLADAIASHEAAARDTAAAHRDALDRAAAMHRDELVSLTEASEREANELRARLTAARRALDEAQAAHTAEREAADAAHAQALGELRATHERAVAVANGELVRVKAVADADHHRALAARDTDHERATRDLTAAHAAVLAELAAERDEIRRGLSSARDTTRRLESELADAVQTIADRNAELRTHTAAITERDQRLVDLRGELAAIEIENTAYQEQVLQAYKKIKSDEVMVARAKKAMAIALTVLDDDAKPRET